MKLATAEDLSVYVNLRMHEPLKVITPDRQVKSVVSAHHDLTLNDKIMFTTSDGQKYSYENLIYYRPEFDGVVTAVHICLKNGYQPVARLTFAFGGMYIFEWDRCDIRDIFNKGINAYTIFYDDRAVRPFTDWIKPIQGEPFPELTMENAEIGKKYAFCMGWVEVIEIIHMTEEQANQESLMYLDHWRGVDWNGNPQGGAFTDGRKISTTKSWEINKDKEVM